MSKKTWVARLYLGRDENGKQQFKWIGRYPTKRERDKALAEARIEHERGGSAEFQTCDEYVDRYLADYKRRNRGSSHDTQTQRLKRFKKDFAGRSLNVPRQEMKDWVYGEGRWSKPIPKGDIPAVVSLFNYAIDEDDLPLKRNPARGLSERGKGRSEEPPPTEEEFQRLLDACDVLGEYAPRMRAMFLFAAFELMRPSELYPLEPSDIDFKQMRIGKARRLYRGTLDEPKTGKKVIALTPPGRDALLGLPLEGRYVFTSKTGKRMSQGMLSNYWLQVQAAAGLRFDFYHATKHYGVWFMWTQRKMSERAIAAQAGWSLKTVMQMLETYGHGDVGALEEVDAAWEDAEWPVLRAIEGGRK
jgi:integrase